MNETRHDKHYVFTDTDQQLELSRLQEIESIFDPGTTRLLSGCGDLRAKSCLEVGAGAGSIARWLGHQVGNAGHVCAIDMDTRFLDHLDDHIEVLQGSVSKVDLATITFDAAHTRFVLVHNADFYELLRVLLARLKRGAYLAIEEPDFSTAHAFAASPQQQRAFENVNAAIERMFGARQQRHDLGKILPRCLAQLGSELLDVQCWSPVVRGGSPIAKMMRMSTVQLSSKYQSTGLVTAEDLQHYEEFTRDTNAWGLYHSTVRVLARRPR